MRSGSARGARGQVRGLHPEEGRGVYGGVEARREPRPACRPACRGRRTLDEKDAALALAGPESRALSSPYPAPSPAPLPPPPPPPLGRPQP